MMKFLSDKSANTFFPIILNHLVNVHTKRSDWHVLKVSHWPSSLLVVEDDGGLVRSQRKVEGRAKTTHNLILSLLTRNSLKVDLQPLLLV